MISQIYNQNITYTTQCVLYIDDHTLLYFSNLPAWRSGIF